MASRELKNRVMWVVLLVCAAGVVGIVYFTDMATESTTPDPVQQTLPQAVNPAGSPTFTPGPQPPGEAPPGKVWSAEHGHWHDAPGATQPISIQAGENASVTPAFTPSPQPPGDPPPGKIWNEPHGHWHDDPGATQPTSILPGATPPAPPTFTPAPQPPGDPPPGKIWNEPHGHWHDDPSQATTPQSPTIRQIEVKPKDNP